MTDLPRLQTTLYGQKGPRGRYPLDSPPPADHVSFDLALVGVRYGRVRIIRPERRYTKGWAHVYVATECVDCGASQWTYLANLTTGKSKGCQACSRPRRAPLWLMKRVTAMKQRCTNPNDKGYKNYGERGVLFKFDSVLAGALWIQSHLGLDQSREIDRINNDGHYEPGNLKYSTRSEQSRNTRQSVVTVTDAAWVSKSPYAAHTTNRLLRAGHSVHGILQMAFRAVSEKRKGWRRIQQRLRELGYTIS